MQKIIDSPTLKVYADQVTAIFDEHKILNGELLLHKKIKERILKYTDLKERQLRILGKMLLIKLLNDMGYSSRISLESITYTEKNKPVLKGIEFSIAHSGSMSIAAVNKNGEIGIDIEEIKAVDLAGYEFYFTLNELDFLKDGDQKEFYRLWTRKEALAKATGEGIFLSFGEISVLGNEVVFKNKKYNFKELDLGEDYAGAICFEKICE